MNSTISNTLSRTNVWSIVLKWIWAYLSYDSYDTGISGKSSCATILKEFFPLVYKKEIGDQSADQCCRFDSVVLTLLTSSVCHAALTSFLFASKVTRKFGRRVIGVLVFLIGAVINWATLNITMLIADRILLGVGVGFANQRSSLALNVVDSRTKIPLGSLKFRADGGLRKCSHVKNYKRTFGHCNLFQPFWKKLHKSFLCTYDTILIRCHLPRKVFGYDFNRQKVISWKDKLKHDFSVLFLQLVAGALIASFSLAVNKSPSLALTEENILFLEAWKTIDRAYVDKSFNGQSWFRYRETALRNEPMNTREQTYVAIKKMLASLEDPFTRFLEPEKFKSLRSGTQGALTGVGLSIGYPTIIDGPSTGLVVISSTPGAPASRAGIISGDIILEIDGTNTGTMGIYDAAERLQGPDGSSVELTIQSGSDLKQISLKRERVSLNPVKSRLCEVAAGGKGTSKIGYIKLTTFNQNASSAVKEAIETLRRNNVTAFVLDLRDNSGGLFPEGIEIAKIWLEKGVIVYICDSRGVRDIYEADGGDAIATSEPLAVLVNKGTASASEILAGALKDNKRAVLFGEATFGKGKIQSVFELSDGSGLAVTVARYETPAHTDIDKVGVIPDHPLPASFPKDEDGFCRCLKDPASTCHLNNVALFAAATPR